MSSYREKAGTGAAIAITKEITERTFITAATMNLKTQP